MRFSSSLLCVCSLLLARPAGAQDWKQWVPKLPTSPRGEQKQVAAKILPVSMQLRPSSEPPRAPHVIRVRVWAAADFRRQTREWQARFRRIVERVNLAGRQWPGLQFEIVEMRNWARESSEGALPALVDELQRLDPGDDVDLVVGLVCALPVFPGAIDNIGMAKLFSRHMVMRSLHDLAEYDDVRRYFDTFTDSEREAIVAARKLHKEQAIFLHEWAHTLGVPHIKRESGIMNPAYSPSMTGFDATEAQLIEAALAHRNDEMRAIIETSPDPDWDPRDRQQVLALLTQSRPSTPSAPSAAPTPVKVVAEAPLADAERNVVVHAVALARAGHFERALEMLAPVDAKHPHSAEVRIAACELTAHHPSKAARAALTEAACKAATELAPRDPRPLLVVAALYVDAGDAPRAQASLDRAGALLDGSDADTRQSYEALRARVRGATRTTRSR